MAVCWKVETLMTARRPKICCAMTRMTMTWMTSQRSETCAQSFERIRTYSTQIGEYPGTSENPYETGTENTCYEKLETQSSQFTFKLNRQGYWKYESLQHASKREFRNLVRSFAKGNCQIFNRKSEKKVRISERCLRTKRRFA